MGILVSITERMEGSKSGDRSRGACACRGNCLQKGESTLLERLLLGFYYHIISYCIVLSSHGGKAPGAAGGFGLSVEILIPSRWKVRSALCCSWVKAL